MSEYCVGVGGGVGAAPMGGEVDKVVMERLCEGRRLLTMGGRVGVSPIRPRWAGMEKIKMTVVWNRRLVSASAVGLERRRWGGRSMRL